MGRPEWPAASRSSMRGPVGERDAQLDRLGVRRYLDHPHRRRLARGATASRATATPGQARRPFRDRPTAIPSTVLNPSTSHSGSVAGPTRNVPHDRRSAVAFGDGHPLADLRAAHGVLEHHAAANQANGLEASESARTPGRGRLPQPWARARADRRATDARRSAIPGRCRWRSRPCRPARAATVRPASCDRARDTTQAPAPSA